ncbi:putative glycolipid-binding domain-containing protein [Actinokineospora enzanensis]|uniref:putative glycolipid-binding domain-containing protein n=1 Tax=Actinokineospora enzanensis TaxID=155975 RepID=UPI000370FA23|nr:putative glycolipid-binding domain-containing protein [Actinokineospora enzanensis]
MSTDATTDRVADGGTRLRNPAVYTWQGARPTTLESVRLLLADGRLRASGRLIAVGDPAVQAEPFSASFDVYLDRGEQACRLLLRTTTAAQERQISLSRTEDGPWLLDRGDTSQRDDFEGSVTLGVAGVVTLASLPIRRFGLHREVGEHELPVVLVSLPDLEIQLVRQTYRTVSVNESGAVIAFTQGEFTTELTVDTEGVVIDYPGIASRV